MSKNRWQAGVVPVPSFLVKTLPFVERDAVSLTTNDSAHQNTFRSARALRSSSFPSATNIPSLRDYSTPILASEAMPPGIIASHTIENKRCLSPVTSLCFLTGRGEFVCSQRRRNYSGIASAALNFSLLLSFSFKRKESRTSGIEVRRLSQGDPFGTSR
jgi:hypothetical protein